MPGLKFFDSQSILDPLKEVFAVKTEFSLEEKFPKLALKLRKEQSDIEFEIAERMLYKEELYDELEEYNQLLDQKSYFLSTYNSLNYFLQNGYNMQLISDFKSSSLIKPAITAIKDNFEKLLNLATKDLTRAEFKKSEDAIYTKLEIQMGNLMAVIELLQKIKESYSDEVFSKLVNQEILETILKGEKTITEDDQENVEKIVNEIINSDKKLKGP